MSEKIIQTERLILRPWRMSDLEPFALLNADPVVREFFSTVLTKEVSDRHASMMAMAIEERGWGLWAAEVPGVSPFIGFIGLSKVPFTAHFTPAVEIGWRLATPFWGKGYATEGARAALKYGFEEVKLDEIVSFTPTSNVRSRNVMEKIGMQRSPSDDFDHPNVPKDHPLARHVLYRAKSHPA